MVSLKRKSIVALAAVFALAATFTVGAQDKPKFDPNFHIYLLIGQSNMEGAPRAEAQDKVENPRIKVLGYRDYPSLDRKYNVWSVAVPPLHSSYTGVGPGDYFARTMIQSAPANVTIGLVPCGLNGVDIDYFRKGVVSSRRKEFKIPPDDNWSGAYDWVVSRAKVAQQYGVIKGILFHQGESDSGQTAWIGKVNEMVGDLRKDLNIPDAPILIGELLYGGACAGHNSVIQQAVKTIPNAWLVSAKDLNGMDKFHFDLASQRELGKRYALVMQAVQSGKAPPQAYEAPPAPAPKAKAEPAKAKASTAAGKAETLDLSLAKSPTDSGITYAADKKTLNIKGIEYVEIPLSRELANGESVDVVLKGTNNGTVGFRSWLVDNNVTTLSNILKTAEVAGFGPGAFELKYTLTATGPVMNFFIKGPAYGTMIDDITISSVQITYK